MPDNSGYPDPSDVADNSRLPPEADQRLKYLMDRNSEGLLTEDEHDELESLVEASENLSLVRAAALRRARKATS